MLNYLFAEIYRVLSKKSLYIYFGVLACAYALLVFVRADGIDSAAIADDAAQLITFLPALLGGYLFAALYTDDLGSKNLTTLIGFGTGKTRIIISKLILIASFSVVIFTLIPLFMFVVYTIFGNMPTLQMLGFVYAYALKSVLLVIVYSAISSIVVYGLQRNTFAIVLYILLSTSVIAQLLTALFNWDLISSIIPHLSDLLVSSLSLDIMSSVVGGPFAWTAFAGYLVYVALACLLAAVAFHKKELEF